MLIRKILIGLALLPVLTACNQHDDWLDEADESAAPVFYAQTDALEGNNRTLMDENRNILWQKGDEVSIFNMSTYPERYILKTGEGTTNASFEAVKGDDGFHSGNEISHNVAVYPYSAEHVIKNGKLEGVNVIAYELDGISIPNTQQYAAGSFHTGLYPMVALTINKSLSFKNVCGMLKLQLKGTAKVSSISVKGGNDEILAGKGKAMLMFDNPLPQLTMTSTDEINKQVKLDCGTEGVQLSDQATPFFITLPPTDFKQGFTVTVTLTDGTVKTFKANASAANKISRNMVLVMPALTVNC